MKKVLGRICTLAMIALCTLPSMAELNGTGFYRVRNAQNTGNYISIANDRLVYSTIVNSGGGATNLALSTSTYAPYALNCVDAYLRNDIHLVTSEFIDPATIIYAKKIQSNDYNLIGQGTSLLTLTTGMYDGSGGDVYFENLNVTISRASGSGENTLYTASILLKARAVVSFFGEMTKTLGTRYFVDNNGTFAISESSSANNAKWYVDQVPYFNVLPEWELNGKYYTTLKVPFEFQLSGQVEKAYAITNSVNGVIQYDVIATTGGNIPAGTPVILECGSSDPALCQLIPVGAPLFPAPVAEATSAPKADESSSYTGTNLLKGTYFCNDDQNLEYINYKNDTLNLKNANRHVTAATGPQKYVLGFTESGKFGFVKATGNMPINKAWIETGAGEFPTVATPTINPATETYNEAQTVTITAEEDATIYYTTDGTEPTTASNKYTAPFTVSESTTVKAIAVKDGLYNRSAVASEQFDIVILNPVLTIAPDVLTINDSGVNNILTITGSDINGNINAGLADNNDWILSPETFSNTGGEVYVTYTGRALSAQNTVNAYAANNPSVTASANVTYTPDIYIVTDNGVENNWNFNEGTMMDNENGIYTATFTTTVPDTYILFARKLGDGVNWNTRYVFGPSSDNDWWMPTDVTSQNGAIDVNDDDPIKLQLIGEYTITINANNYTFTITRTPETLTAPTFSPAAGNYTEAQNVVITSQEGATIYYTTDGTDPTTESAIYTEPITVGEGTTTIKAVAVKAGWYNSEVATAVYVIEIPSTALLGDVNGNGVVNISDVSVLIDYLLNDTTPIVFENSDMNQDGEINISDVSILIDQLLEEQ